MRKFKKAIIVGNTGMGSTCANTMLDDSAKKWWYSLTDIKRIEYIEKLYGLKVNEVEIRNNISNNEIETLYYFRHLF